MFPHRFSAHRLVWAGTCVVSLFVATAAIAQNTTVKVYTPKTVLPEGAATQILFKAPSNLTRSARVTLGVKSDYRNINQKVRLSRPSPNTVSYTHLTLPTILRV